MAVPTFHHIGTFLLLAAWVLLLVVSISSPVINDLSLCKVTLTNSTNLRNSAVTFGSFGYCILDVPPVDTDQDYCVSSRIGYPVTNIMANIEGTDFNVVAHSTVNGLTNAFVLHPVAAVIAFVAFLVALLPTFIFSFIASLIAVLAFVLSLVVMAIDFSVFGVIKNNVNKDGSGSHARYGTAMWLVLAATLCLFFGSIIVFFSCCASRRKSRAVKHEGAYANGTNGTGYGKRRFWQRKNRY